MPLFRVERVVKQELIIEAPDHQFATKAAENLASYEWGYETEEIIFRGQAPGNATIDVTVDLEGQEHPCAFEDEDTGACIYCGREAPEEEEAAADVQTA